VRGHRFGCRSGSIDKHPKIEPASEPAHLRLHEDQDE
jgi:hypothetical protein